MYTHTHLLHTLKHTHTYTYTYTHTLSLSHTHTHTHTNLFHILPFTTLLYLHSNSVLGRCRVDKTGTIAELLQCPNAHQVWGGVRVVPQAGLHEA